MSEPQPDVPFSRKATWWLVSLCAVSFLCALLFAALGRDPGAVPDHTPTTYSDSAIGHHAFKELLRKLNVPVVVSRRDSGQKAGVNAVLIVAEPRGGHEQLVELTEMLSRAETAVVVLPKRAGSPRRSKKAWLDDAWLVDTGRVEEVLQAIGCADCAITRYPTAQPYDSELALKLDLPQLVISDELEPIVSSTSLENPGVLIGTLNTANGEVVIVADPDLIANFAMANGANAVQMIALIDRLRGGDRPVIFDETLHGRKSSPSLWRELVTFPLALASIAALLAVLVLLLAAIGRFGAPVPPRPGIEPGKGFLIANTAALIRLGGHSTHALSRYLATTVQDVARLSHAPPELGADRLRDWLEQLAEARKLPVRLRDLEREVDSVVRGERGRREHRVVLAAGRIHSWRRSMIGEERTR